MFGCESWSLTKDLVDKINGSYTRMLRRAKNITWSDFILNKILYADSGVSKITQRIKSVVWRWLDIVIVTKKLLRISTYYGNLVKVRGAEEDQN